MTNPEFGAPTAQAPMPPRAAVAGPCGSARAEVDLRCADAERVLAAAETNPNTLREARRQHFEASRLRESDNSLRDRRALGEEKAAAQAKYHQAVNRAVDLSSVQAAAAVWMARINQLNNASRTADDRADALAQQVGDLERALPGLEMAADAARVAAEAAQEGCLESRRAFAACEEESHRRGTPQVAGQGTVQAAPVAEAPAAAFQTARPPQRGQRIMRRASRQPER